MDKGGLVPGSLSARWKALDEQGCAARRCRPRSASSVSSATAKVLEQAGHLQGPAGGRRPAISPDGLVKIRAEGKADAAHAGVRLEMDLHPAARCAGRFAQSLGLFQRVAGRRDVVPDEVGGARWRRHGPESGWAGSRPACRSCNASARQLHGQPGRPLLGKDPGTLHGPVAVAVGLDDGAEGQLPGPLLDRPEILPQGVQINLGPDVFFKNLVSA